MNGQLSASDVMALTKDNDGFGGVGLIISKINIMWVK